MAPLGKPKEKKKRRTFSQNKGVQITIIPNTVLGFVREKISKLVARNMN